MRPRPIQLVLESQPAIANSVLRSCRPHQWIKNLPVLAALFFSPEAITASTIGLSCLCFVAFCFAASAVYLLNDLCDLESDRRHPTKSLRPIASGLVPPYLAIQCSIGLGSMALVAATACHPTCTVLIVAYLLINVAYSFWLKHWPVVDVVTIAAGFVIRGVAGAFAIGVEPSGWLTSTLALLALYIGFGKRRCELTRHAQGARHQRLSLSRYNLRSLELILAVTAAFTLVTYGMYALAGIAAGLDTLGMQLSVLLVGFGLWRFDHLGSKTHSAEDPARLLLTDWPMLANCTAWILVIFAVFHGFGAAS